MALDGASLVRNGIRVPRSAPRAARISAAEGAWLEVSDPSLSPFTPPQVVSDTVIFREAARSTDVVFVAGPNHLEELRVLRDGRASPVARYRLEHGPAIAVVRLREGRVEAVDAHGVVRVASAPAFAIDATGRRRDVVLRLADDTLEARVDLEGLTFPVVVDPTWSTVAPMATAGHGASAVLLTDGRVLVTGGDPITKSGEVYDPKLNTWTTAKPLELHRFPLAVRLGSGKVLVAGGMSYTTELFDPASGAYSKTGNLTATHQNGAIALLPSGKVLVAAGFSDGGQVGETYDPTTGVWTPTPPLVAYRDGPGAALLSSGRVLLAGGHDPGGTLQSSAEIYNPTTNTWTAAASMSAGRRHMAIAVLPTGKVLVAGGGEPAGLLSSAEIYDPATNTWTSAPSMAVPRTFARATVLTSGRILVAGGIKAFSEVYSSAEVFDGTSFSSAGAMAYGRFEHTQTLLADGKVLIAGGHTLSVDLSTAEVFAYSAPGEACVSALGCVSGQCVDGVCCNTGCAAACDACDVGGALGTCSKVASGAPHGGRSCGAYGKCLAGACATSCGGDGDCAVGFYCAGTACVAKKAAGATCGAANECGSGHCVDGVCCDTACTGQCQACDVLGKIGACSPVVGAPKGTRPSCGGIGAGTACGARCDGIDVAACHLPGTTTACGADTCVGGVEGHVGTCDGAGKCPDTAVSCAAYACGATACKKTCASKADCAPGYLCSGTTCVPIPGLGEPCTDAAGCTSGFCTDGVCCGVASCGAGSSCAAGAKGLCAKVPGTACAAGAECGSLACVDGVCCDRACEGQCEACDVPGKLGACTPIAGEPHKDRARCDAGAGDVCRARSCNGALDPKACVGFLHGPTTVCRPATCVGAELSPAGACDGAGGCSTPPTSSCSPFRCVDGVCKDRCASKADCAEGFECSAGACKPAGGACSADRTTSTAVDGTVTPCAPYRCRTDGRCGETCASSSDCAPDAACDVSLGKCVPTATADAGGGCTTGGGPGSGLALAALALAGLVRGRRRS